MQQFDWGDIDETDDEFLQRNNWLFQKDIQVEKMINKLKLKLKNIRNWNRMLQCPIEIMYSGYPKDKEIMCVVSFKKPLNYHICIIIKFSPDTKLVFVNYQHNYIELDNTEINSDVKIINFISNIITQHVKGTYKECDELNVCKLTPSWLNLTPKPHA